MNGQRRALLSRPWRRLYTYDSLAELAAHGCSPTADLLLHRSRLLGLLEARRRVLDERFDRALAALNATTAPALPYFAFAMGGAMMELLQQQAEEWRQVEAEADAYGGDPSEADECPCGWTLPHSVVAYPNGAEPGPGTFAPGVYVALNCPECGRGHGFVNAMDPAAEAEAARQYQHSRKGLA